MNAKVSVIIPNYNYEKFISRTVESVLSQTYQNIEIIVVDDGSKDGSLDVLKGFGDRIRVVEQKNAGVSAARNHGVEVSTGELVAFLDADDVWLPEKLERQLEKMNSDPEIGLVHCSMTLIDPADNPIGEKKEGQEGRVANEFLLLKRGVVIGAGSTALVRRAVFDEAGGFDRRLSTAADWEFCYRVARLHKIGFVREPLVLYRMHGTNMHGNVKAMEHDVLIGFEKAFAGDAEDLRAIRRECYGNLYLSLAGSYFQSKKYSKFFESASKCFWYTPGNLGYFLKFPFRRFGRSSK
ncbi:MAG: glycosyltransferase [Acidobacteria bacterium]|nr:glycosyltransferase [Acidobacteriota bacterium]